MRQIQRLLILSFLILLVACQAPVSPDAVTETPPASTTTPATAMPQTATEAPAVTETAAPLPATEAPPTETPASEPVSTGVFDYLIDAYYGESGGWQLRGARRTSSGAWESSLVPLGEPVSVGGVHYAPATHSALIWDYSGNQGAGPANLSAGPLHLVDLATNSVETLFPGDVVSARMAPDGQGYAYLLATADTYELHLRDAAGDDRIVARDVPREFTFSPDGGALAFTRESGYRLPGTPGLYVVDLGSGAEQMLHDVDRAGMGGSGSSWAPLWSPDGAGLLLRAYAGDSDRLIWAARDGSWSHALLLEDLDGAAGVALGEENICTNQEFLLTASTALITGAGPCPDEPLMGAMPEATHLVLLQLDSASGTLTPGATIPAPAATFFLLGYRPQSASVVLHDPADPVNTVIHEVALP